MSVRCQSILGTRSQRRQHQQNVPASACASNHVKRLAWLLPWEHLVHDILENNKSRQAANTTAICKGTTSVSTSHVIPNRLGTRTQRQNPQGLVVSSSQRLRSKEKTGSLAMLPIREELLVEIFKNFADDLGIHSKRPILSRLPINWVTQLNGQIPVFAEMRQPGKRVQSLTAMTFPS